jgi:hypothetical protein
MNENPILPARIYIFFSPLLYPKIFPPTYPKIFPPTYHIPPRPTYHLPPPSYLPPTCPLLPTTYKPLPPHSIALHRQSFRGVKRERAWSKSLAEQRSESLERGARAWSRGAGAGPTQDPGKHLTFVCLFFLFVEPLFVLQEK